MDKAKIPRLLDEADDIVSALYRQGANKDYKCKLLREKLKAIAAEISEPPKSNADRIRQMTDEELAEWITDGHDLCDLCQFSACLPDYGCEKGVIAWLKQEAESNDR